MANMERLRHRMVDRQIASRGISDHRLLTAMRDIPRHCFVPEPLQDYAYDDMPCL